MKVFLTVPALLLVAGCAGLDHAMEYSGVEVVMVTTQRADFRVFDKPEESRMMVTPTIGAAAGQGFLSGLTFGAADTDYPKPWFQEAAEAHLSNTVGPRARSSMATRSSTRNGSSCIAAPAPRR